jgi:hypothetical protein
LLVIVSQNLEVKGYYQAHSAVECIHETNDPVRQFVLHRAWKLFGLFTKAVFPDVSDISVAKLLGQILTIHLKDERKVLK